MDRKKVVKGLEICTSKPCYCTDCPYKANCYLDSQEVMEDALVLLKEQDERYVNMVVSWLNEMALNNCQDERPMTFVDAIENIRDRASCGLKQYFNDKLNEKQ